MTISVQTALLKPILRQLSKVPDLREIFIKAASDAVVLTIDSIQTRWSLQCPAAVSQEGSTYVDFNRLNSYISQTEDLTIDLKANHTTLDLATESINAHLPVTDGSLFPSTRTILDSAKRAQWDRATFSNAVAACATCAANVDGFSYTTGLLVTTNPATGIVIGTDRKRYISQRFHAQGDPVDFTVSSEQLLLASQFHSEKIDVVAQDNNIRLKAPSFMCDLLPYQESIPKHRDQFLAMMQAATIKAEIDTSSLIYALSLVQSVASKRDNVWTYIDLSPTSARLRCNGDRIDETNIRLAGHASQPVQIWINPTQILNTISPLRKKQIIQQQVQIHIIDQKSPIFIPLSDDGQDFLLFSALIPPTLQSQ